MELIIRDMRPEDADAKGCVHWKTWQETYTGLMDEKFIVSQTLDKCRSIAHRWPENTLVVEIDGKIVGFSCYGSHESGAGEVIAIYLLKEAQGFGLGRKLMDATLRHLEEYSSVFLWALKGNDHAIGFYEHYGFRLDGVTKDGPVGTELRMTYTQKGDCL